MTPVRSQASAGLLAPAASPKRALLLWAVALAAGLLALLTLQASRNTSPALAERLLRAGPGGGGGGAAAAKRPPAAAAGLPALPQPPRVFEDPPKGKDDSYVALCIAVKDEHCDIREWVLHHATLGVQRMQVYVFDTQSQPPMEAVLEDFIASGLVVYEHFRDPSELDLPPPTPGRSHHWQRPLYARCLERHGARHRWLGFIDADEFIILTGEGEGDGGSGGSGSSDEPGSRSAGGSGAAGPAAAGLPALLRRYEQHGGLALHWRQFGFSGHIERARDGVLAGFAECCPRDACPAHLHFKSLVQPRYAIAPQTVHSFRYRPGRGAVNTAGVPAVGPRLARGQKASYRGAALHHYISRSLADFEAKQARRAGDGSVKTLAHFLQWHRAATGTCTAAVPLGRALAARWDLNRNVPQRCLLWAQD